MKSIMVAICASLIMTSAFSYEGFKAGSYSIKGKASDESTLKLNFRVEKDGTISSLYGDMFHFIQEFAFDEKDAIENFGMYKQIPLNFFQGSCTQAKSASWHMNCVLTINFTDEEVTTLMIHFEDNFDHTPSGAILESHGDQAMQLYQKAFEFKGIRTPLTTII